MNAFSCSGADKAVLRPWNARQAVAPPASLPAWMTCHPCRRVRGARCRLVHLAVASTSTSGFHQARMVATERGSVPLQRLNLSVRLAETDEELQAAAWLRAQSFYAYPPERKFAGEIHQIMVAEEEFSALKAAKLQRKLGADNGSGEGGSDRSGCIVAVCSAAELPGLSKRLLLREGSGEAVVGTLDLHAARALPGEVLIGNSSSAGYLANVCVAAPARRRRVGEALLDAARALAREWGVQDLYVHTMAVNEAALRFYKRNAFVVEKEESSNQAHYRGRCLDGVEGRGRTCLLRDTRLLG